LLDRSLGETLGGLARSLAGFGELNAANGRLAAALAGGLCRSDTDLFAGMRRGWRRAASDCIVPGGSFMFAQATSWRWKGYRQTAHIMWVQSAVRRY
jgi:hypothetical protein